MAKVNFKRRLTKEEVDKIPIEDCNLIIEKSGAMYCDYGDERVRLSYNSGGSVDGILIALGLDNDTYSTSKTYTIDDLVVYNHTIYQCKTAVTTAEEFDSSKWELVPFFVNEN